MQKNHGNKKRVHKDNLEKWSQYLQEEPEYTIKLHELFTQMVKEILIIIKEKEINLYTLARHLHMTIEELLACLEFKNESFAIYHWILKTVRNWDKEEKNEEEME